MMWLILSRQGITKVLLRLHKLICTFVYISIYTYGVNKFCHEYTHMVISHICININGLP